MATNVSSVASHFPDAENGFTTTTAGSVASGASTVTLNSVSGYTNGEPVVLVIDPTDATKKQTFTGIVDTAGVQVTSVVWTAGTNQTHALGATVVDYATATHIAMMSKGIKVEHSQAGTHTNITQADANYIKDDAGNELLKWSKTASAVNEVTIKNAATGTDPRISASGGDTAVNLNLRGKGLAKTVTIGAGATVIYPYDYVASGCVWTGDSYGGSLAASMTAGVVVINGNPITVAAVTARAFTTNVDTYIDVLDAGDGTGTVVYTTAATNAASPALASNSIRIGIIQAAATITAATKVNQGQEDRVFPIASSIPYAVTDSLGNLICPRDPMCRTVGYRQIVSAYSGTTNGGNGDDVTGLAVPFIANGLTKVRASIGGKSIRSSAGAGATVSVRVVEGTTELASVTQQITTNSYNMNPNLQSALITPSAGLHTYKANLVQAGAGTQTLDGASTNPAFIRIERA